RFDQALGKPTGLALSFGQVPGKRANELGLGLLLRRDKRSDCRGRLIEPLLLNFQLLLLFDPRLKDLKVIPLRSNLLVKEGLADADALLQNRNEDLNLLNCSRSSLALSFLLSLLPLQRLELGSMLRDLVQQESFVGGDSLEARPRRRVKLGERIEVLGDRGERSVEPGDVKLRGDEIVSQLSALGLIHGGVELD